MTTAVITNGVSVTCYTNNAVHLWFRWTNIVPQKHIIAREQRGGLVNTYIDQCFVAFHDVEQNEANDTWTHTFTILDWPSCETRWFYFWGQVGGQLSPSASCIFTYHRPYQLTLYSDPGGGLSTADGHAGRFVTPGSWANIQGGIGTTANYVNPTMIVAIGAYAPPNWWAHLYRAKLVFPTNLLPPDARVKAAALHFKVSTFIDNLGAQPSLALVTAHAPPYNYVVSDDYQAFGSTPLAPIVPFAQLTALANITMTLDQTALSWLSPNHPTALGLRFYTYDVIFQEPPWSAYKMTTLSIYSADVGDQARRPHLVIDYTTP